MTAGQHGTVRIPPEVRMAIRQSPESVRALARRYAINPKTVAKWKLRDSPDDLRSGPKAARAGKLTAEEEDIITRFREHTLLPLDDCLYALQAQIPHLTRSSLHRCLQRHGISRLARPASGANAGEAGEAGEAGKPGEAGRAGKAAHLGCLHIDRSDVRSADGVHYLFNAIDEASKFVFVQMGPGGGSADAGAFLAMLCDRLPFRIAQVFTQACEPFVTPGAQSAFAQLCRARGIEHRLTSSPHPSTRKSGAHVGRMIEDGLTFDSADYIAALLRKFVQAYNCRRRLKTLGGRTPQAFLCDLAARQPELFLRDPHHEMVGLEIITG